MLGLMNSVTKYYFVPRADTFRATCLSNPVHMYFSLIDFTRLTVHYMNDSYISVLFRIYTFLSHPWDTLLGVSAIFIVLVYTFLY